MDLDARTQGKRKKMKMRKATALDGIPIEVQNFIQVDKIILLRSYRKNMFDA